MILKLPVISQTDTIVILILALVKTELFANKFKVMQKQPFGKIGVLVNFDCQELKFL